MTEPTETSARESVLAHYRPIRASVQAVLDEAVVYCRKADFERAAKHLGLMDEALLDDEQVASMLADVALCEPNQRGRRAYDGFLQKALPSLAPSDQRVARRMGEGFFSIFRVAGRHVAAGVWLEDLLTPERRIWLVDEALEASAPEGLTIGMRVFDAEPFHAGFGIVVVPAPDLVEFCTEAAARGQRLPIRHSLAAALYAEEIARSAVLDEADVLDELRAMAEMLDMRQARRRPLIRAPGLEDTDCL